MNYVIQTTSSKTKKMNAIDSKFQLNYKSKTLKIWNKGFVKSDCEKEKLRQMWCVSIAGRTLMNNRISAGNVWHIEAIIQKLMICGGAVWRKELMLLDVESRSILPLLKIWVLIQMMTKRKKSTDKRWIWDANAASN